MGLKRGEVVVVIASGDYGKPRPALVLQSDAFPDTASVVVALLTTDLHPKAPLFRKPIKPSEENGLRQPSEVMIDKVVSLPRIKIGTPIGHLSITEMTEITASLALFFGM